MILDDIVQYKRGELLEQKREVSLDELMSALKDAPPARDFTGAIRRAPGSGVKIIAEVKRASPSKGVIREDFNPVEIARAYEANGASAISVLTDKKFFQGELSYLTDVKSAVSLPILRKDFIIDEYQIFQSRIVGADAILLIAAILSTDELKGFLNTANETGLHCLVEAHDEAEVDTSVAAGAQVIGINNRNLKTFSVDTSTTARLAPRIPAGRIIVSESGIGSRGDILFLEGIGAHAALIGESLMRSEDIGSRLREFTDDQNQSLRDY